ncbi:MAG: hypothetical protein VX672_00095 [Planctomycetota bacterium]|nr:hypothetical protein [Planctomycetota bacterium]
MIQMLAMTASMLLVGWIVWKAINRREEGDETLQARLEEDDRRAAIGRGENPDLNRDRDRNGV